MGWVYGDKNSVPTAALKVTRVKNLDICFLRYARGQRHTNTMIATVATILGRTKKLITREHCINSVRLFSGFDTLVYLPADTTTR